MSNNAIADKAKTLQAAQKIPSAALPHMKTGQRLKIDTAIAVTRAQERISAVCSYTGIVVDIIIPSIPGVVFEYTSPFSYHKNAIGIINQGEAYLRKLDLQILAGIWLTVYRHYNLLNEEQTNSSIANALLRTAGREPLISSLLFTQLLSQERAKRLPQFHVAYSTHAETPNLSAAITDYTKSIRDILYPPTATSAQKEADRLVKEADKISIYEVQSTKTKASKVTSAADLYLERSKGYHKEAKLLIAEIEENMILSVAFISYLKGATQKDTILSIDSGMRAKLVNKLQERKHSLCDKLASIIADAAPSTLVDIFGDSPAAVAEESKVVAAIEKGLEAAPVTDRPVPLKQRLADILAAKKAAEGKA